MGHPIEVEKRLSTGEKATSSSNKLPTLPLPDLDSTLSMYLDSRKFFLSQNFYKVVDLDESFKVDWKHALGIQISKIGC